MLFVSKSVAETVRMGEVIGQSLRGGEVIGLIGELGTGKTHLIKGIASGLGVAEAAAVTSPTFTLINEYEGRLGLYHVDAYRLEDAGQLEKLGFDELCGSAGVVVVEWADRVWELVAAYEPMRVLLRHVGESEREILVEDVPDYVGERLGVLDSRLRGNDKVKG